MYENLFIYSMKRIFIVGVARSGTTLLQSFFAASPSVMTFPESHIFRLTVPRSSWKQKLHIVSDADIKCVRDFLSDIRMENCFAEYKDVRFGIAGWFRYVLSTFDLLAQSSNKSIWVEKTPMHLHYIDCIQKIDPKAVIIHMVRNPYDNIAALYDVSKKYPEAFHQATLDQSIARYVGDLKLIQKHSQCRNNYVVYYEDLVRDAHSVISSLCDVIEVDYDESMMDFRDAAGLISNPGETWKSSNRLELNISDKLRDRLTADEIEHLMSCSSLFDISVLERYK